MTNPEPVEVEVTEERTTKSRLSKWVPRKWHAIYDQIVILDTLGRSRTELATMFNYTPQQISNIVSTPQAADTRKKIHDKIIGGMGAELPQRLERVAQKAMERIENYIASDVLAEGMPNDMFDRAVKALQIAGKARGGLEGVAGHINNTQVNQIIFNKTDVTELREAIELSAKAKELNNPFAIMREVDGRSD